jgi:hypothetical protein
MAGRGSMFVCGASLLLGVVRGYAIRDVAVLRTGAGAKQPVRCLQVALSWWPAFLKTTGRISANA